MIFKKKNAEHRRLLEESKKEYFLKFLSGINTKTSISEVWKRVGALKPKGKKTNISCLNDEKGVILEKKEIANVLAKNMAKISSFNERSTNFSKYKSSNEEINFLNYVSSPSQGSVHAPFSAIDLSRTCTKEVYNTPISMRELVHAIHLCSKDSATGEDGIHYNMIKNLSEENLQYVRNFFNVVYLKGVFPSSWKSAIVIPILKQNSDSKDPNSYRPISLISSLSKILEGIINRRLVWFLEKNNILDINQSGFRIGRNTMDNITTLVTEIQQAFLEKKYHITVFLDLEKAYDTCWKQHVLKQLKSFNLSGCLPLYIQNFLCNRTIKVRVNDEDSDSYKLDMGIPQGSALSGTLFLIAVNSIASHIKSYFKKSFFVDDARFSYITNNLKQAEEKFQGVLNSLVDWGDKTGFNFSETKSEVMIFNRKGRGTVPEIELKLRNKVLKLVTEKKFLGMIFDQKLSWDLHIAKIKNKSISSLNLLKTIASSKCKTSSDILLNVYKSLILSKIEYGSQAYSTAAPVLLNELDPIHNQALRICLGAFKTTPLESLYVESNINSLEKRRHLSNMVYHFRVIQIEKQNRHSNIADNKTILSGTNISTLGFKIKQCIQQYQVGELEILKLKPLIIPPWLIPKIDICFKLSEKSKSKCTIEELKQSFYEHKHISRISMFTDGSKSVNGTGAGVVVFGNCSNTSVNNVYESYRIKLNKLASVFSAELVAIENAVNSLKKANNTTCTIYSDSMSALQAILQYDSRNQIVQNIHILLLKLKEHNTFVKFCWVPAHCGIKGNEIADKTAKESIKFSKRCYNPILLSDIKAFLKQQVANKWKEGWLSRVNNKLLGVDSKIGKKDFSGFDNRIEEIKYTRLRLGHTKITHKFRLLGETQPECDVCNCPLTVNHFLVECPKYEIIRIHCFGNHEIKLSEILQRGCSKKIKKVLSFLRYTHLLSEI